MCVCGSKILSCNLGSSSLVAMDNRSLSLLIDNSSIFLFVDKSSRWLLNLLLMLFSYQLLMLLMDNRLVDFMNVLLVNNGLMDFLNHRLMVLMDDILVMFMENILMMFVDNILVNLFHNRCLDNLLDDGCFLMRLKDCSSFMRFNLLAFMVSNDYRLLLNHLNSCLWATIGLSSQADVAHIMSFETRAKMRGV